MQKIWSCIVGEQLAGSNVLNLLWVKSVELSHEWNVLLGAEMPSKYATSQFVLQCRSI